MREENRCVKRYTGKGQKISTQKHRIDRKQPQLPLSVPCPINLGKFRDPNQSDAFSKIFSRVSLKGFCLVKTKETSHVQNTLDRHADYG